MKEIDFLPTWYKSSRRRKIGYQAQYACIGGIFLAMVIWSFISMHSLSKSEMELAKTKLQSSRAESVVKEFAAIRNEVAHMQKKAKTIKEIDSKIDIANVLAEISYLVGGRVALNKVEFIAKKFGDSDKVKSDGGSTVKAEAAKFIDKVSVPLGDVRFNVLISGVASDANDVVALICRLEDSPYFCHVVPLFTRNRDIKTTVNEGGKKFHVSEFEISCNLANFRQEELYFAEESREGKAVGI